MGSKIQDAAYAAGDVRHSECDCCAHAAKRTVGLRESIEHAVEMIRDGYPGETMLELDRVLSELNEWCSEPERVRGFDKDVDDEHPF